MEQRHAARHGGDQFLVMRCRLAGDLIGIDPWHKTERHGDLAGQLSGNPAMALGLAAAKSGKFFRVRLYIVKHQDNGIGTSLNKLI